jgi:hypothetical protein
VRAALADARKKYAIKAVLMQKFGADFLHNGPNFCSFRF